MKNSIELPKEKPLFYLLTDHLDVLTFSIKNASEIQGEDLLVCDTELLTPNPTETHVFFFKEYQKRIFLNADFSLRESESCIFSNRHDAFQSALERIDNDIQAKELELRSLNRKRDLLSIGRF